jgi:hypothetical protein
MRAVRRNPEQIVIATRGRAGFICLGPDVVLEAAGHDVPVIDSTGAETVSSEHSPQISLPVVISDGH